MFLVLLFLAGPLFAQTDPVPAAEPVEKQGPRPTPLPKRKAAPSEATVSETPAPGSSAETILKFQLDEARKKIAQLETDLQRLRQARRTSNNTPEQDLRQSLEEALQEVDRLRAAQTPEPENKGDLESLQKQNTELKLELLDAKKALATQKTPGKPSTTGSSAPKPAGPDEATRQQLALLQAEVEKLRKEKTPPPGDFTELTSLRERIQTLENEISNQRFLFEALKEAKKR